MFDPEIPHVGGGDLPETEWKYASWVNSNLNQLGASIAQVESCLSLLRHTLELYCSADTRYSVAFEGGDTALAEQLYGEIRDKIRWAEIAARMGAIQIFAFARAMAAIEGLRRNCPTLMSKVDSHARENAEEKFRTAFPGMKDIRDSAAHPGELSNSPKSHKDNAEITGPRATFFVAGSVELIGNERASFEASFRRQRVKYELSAETVEALKDIAREYWSAFLPAEHPDMTKRREEIRQAGFPVSAPR